MPRENRMDLLENHFNPFYKGVCKMKLLRIFMVMALLAVPLFASAAKADFTAGYVSVPFARVSANTVNQPIIGFTIPCGTNDTLKTLALKSFMERAYSVVAVKLWVETNPTPGWQSTDTHLKTYLLNGDRFETEDTIVMGNINRVCSGAGPDTFYITVDAYTDSVNAVPHEYHTKGLEIVIEAGYIHLGLSSGEVNLNRITNPGYRPAVPDPPQPAYFEYFKLVFDTQGPPITVDWCFADDGCKTDTIDQLDSLCIQADTTAFTDAGDAIDGYVELDLSPFCLASNFRLSPFSAGNNCFGEGSMNGWDSCFLIPDTRDCPNCIDVDSGYVITAVAYDSAGNKTEAPLYFDKPIDTCKPCFDSIQFFITYDQNDDGIAAIGDSLSLVAWALCNGPFEVDSMIANLTSYFPSGPPSKQWRQLLDISISNNNTLWRVKFELEETGVEMAADSSMNRVTIWAWDNACNYDTVQQMLNAPVDTRRPGFSECYYYYHWDENDTLRCIGIGDSVLIGANLTGNTDLASVTCNLVEAGIKGSDAQPLFDDGDLPVHGDAAADDQVFNLLWEVGEPPIEDGKDTNNTNPPPIDYDYTVLITAFDEAGNWAECRTPRLNRVLDSRVPRWTDQDNIYIKQLPDARLAIFWPTSDNPGPPDPTNSSNERDAVFFWVFVDSGLGWEPFHIGATYDGEYKADTNMWKSEKLSDGKYYKFRIQQEDDCNNLSDYSKTLGGVADGTPPHVCIAVPDSGLTFGAPFPIKAVADSASHDVDHSCTWYRFRRDLEDPLLPPGQWHICGCMYRFPDGYVFTDTVNCISGYRGWVEMITVSCDVVGNCQDTTMGFDDACLVEGDLFRQGHFLFYWDTLAPGIMVTEVSGSASPQTACGYDVERGEMNWVVIDVDGAEEGELFEVQVTTRDNQRPMFTIFHQDNCAMPCTVWFSVDGWDEGTQNLWFHVKDYDDGITGDAMVQLCIPEAPPEHCIYIDWPTEWMRIPCTGTSGYNCVEISASMYEHSQCQGQTFTEVLFQWSPTGSDPWYSIEDVIGTGNWSTCWDNSDLVEDGDTVYLRAIAHDEHYLADTSYMVKVFVDCSQPAVKLRIEELYYTCADGIPKVPCAPLILKAVLEDPEVDLEDVRFHVKRHSDADLRENWDRIAIADMPWSDNIWGYLWEDPCCDIERAPGDAQARACMWAGDFWDIRIACKDIAGHIMFDYDMDGLFDDSTFNDAVAAGAALTVFVDDEAPEPAFTKVCDMGHEPPICIVNPSSNVDGIDEAYVQAGNDIYVEISPLPSEDTCTVMKVEYFLKIAGNWVHVGTSTDPNHYPITFNPVTTGLIQAFELEDGWWKGDFKAELYDSLGNNEEDWIDLYILDVTPSQAIIVDPLNESYVWGDVDVSILALNAYEIAKVCYEYSSDGETWYPINGGYPNACVSQDCGKPSDSTFATVWHTLNTVEDGDYYLRAVATDCDNNVDDDPPTIMVTVANEPPTAVLDDPRICQRECSDSPLDTLGYVGGTVTLSAAGDSEIPITKMEFYYKSIFGYPDTYTLIDYDLFPTAGKYTVEWDTEPKGVSDGRYHLKARVYNAAGRWADSDPVTVSVDNSAPMAQITAIMGEPVPPEGIDITLGDVIDIELVAIDSTSDDGWTRCYNSGLTGIEVCIEECDEKNGDYTKCFEVSPVYDGFHTVQWNTSGLEFDGCEGCYEFYVRAWDCLGNVRTSEYVTVYVYDSTAPITYIAGFDGSYIYGWSTEEVSTLLFEYADSAGTQWIPIGLSDYIGSYDCNGYTMYLYKTAWDPLALDDGTYQTRVISHDECSNQDDDMAPWAFFSKEGTFMTPYNGDMLGEMAFLKNWCVGGMHGVVLQTVQAEDPMMLVRYMNASGEYSFECVHMQSELQHATDFAGSFYADDIRHGGSAMFFSSATITLTEPPMTGDPSSVTYLNAGAFDIAKVKCDLGTHGIYQEGCVDLTIPDGAIDCSGADQRYVWVGPTYMEWAPVDQADILPIGDDNGFATYISFTDCYYCCGWSSPWFGDEAIPAAGAGSQDWGECCFRDGKYAKIKMCYDSDVDVDAEHLAVAWWDCDEGEYCFDGIFYPATVEGFDTENHTVEFAATCLKGPFVVVQLIERHCEGSIVVDLFDVDPYCNGYTNATPVFQGMITDNVQGTDGIDQGSIQWKVDLFEPGKLVKFYDGSAGVECDFCDCWMPGFGNFSSSGYDEVSGVFRAGFNDPYFGSDHDCEGCDYRYWSGEYWYFCDPLYPLAAGDHMATVTAMNDNIQTCTDTMHFMVDDTAPMVAFADAEGAYVAANPNFCIYFKDTEAGMDKNSVYIDLYGDETSSPDPNNHTHIGTLEPAQINWIDDTTACVEYSFEYRYGYLHAYVYGGPECECRDCSSPQYYQYDCGVADCVGNHTNVFWQYYTVDADAPSIYVDCYNGMISLAFTDDLSGVEGWEVLEDGVPADEGAVTEDPATGLWLYSPATGVEVVTVKAWDNVGNMNSETFTLPFDCDGPMVTFADGYVCKNPTIEFWVTDPAGVDWTTVNARITGCNEECWFWADDLGQYTDEETGKVTLGGCHLDCNDGNEVELYVFSGTSYTGDGPHDLNGNYGKYRRCSFVVDAYAPSISVGDTEKRPIRITITDAKSGVDWETLEFYEDGDDITDDVTVDTETGVILYDAPESGGFEVEIRVNDMTGCNLAVKTFDVDSWSELALQFGDMPHNVPNPFDPDDGPTVIDPELNKCAYVTVKIYDFGGEFVRKLADGDKQWCPGHTWLKWDGRTDGGTMVANGTYLCYVHARDAMGNVKTQVIKITVLKESE